MPDGHYRAEILQPPSGGCVLKPHIYCFIILIKLQPPSGGCVLKRMLSIADLLLFIQPPSGGCVLKLHLHHLPYRYTYSAAFGRLRVETCQSSGRKSLRVQPPSGGCVLKQPYCCLKSLSCLSAAFGRLRVETTLASLTSSQLLISRLRAAAC